uniref:Uncharacterized protein n=1 Tax=Avena sativa TaxID=4498 RepID=A0ACD5WRJ6_AVESA
MESKAPPLAPTGRKRKGRPIPPLAQVTGWASLPDDIARPVAKCDVVDYIAFRAVCSGWRACAPILRDPTLTSRSLRPVDWIPLCDGDAVRPDDACQITFFHCKTARSLRIHLPQLQRHRIVGFTDGLLILLHKRRTTVRVLDPFTGVVVDFPPLFPDNPNGVLRVNAAVCTSVSSTTSIAVVAWFPWRPVVVSVDAGHSSWEVIHNSMDLLNTLPFQGRLYGVLKLSTQIVQVYPPQSPGPAVAHLLRFHESLANPILLLLMFHRGLANPICATTILWSLMATCYLLSSLQMLWALMWRSGNITPLRSSRWMPASAAGNSLE